MSIKNFSTQPCPDCKKDTTHIAMQCRECGHINLTNAQAWILGRKKSIRRKKARGMSLYYVPGLSKEEFKKRTEQIKKAKALERLEASEHRVTVALRGKNGIYGRGRS